MKRWLFGAALVAACTSAYAAALVIENDSLWDIHRIYISSSDSNQWGDDQLDDDILASGQTLTLSGVRCDVYDVKLIDEDGDVCELRGVSLCGDERWTITDEALLQCQGSS